MEVLSEVLKAVKLDGALFYNAEFSAPWCFRAPASRTVAPYLSSDPRQPGSRIARMVRSRTRLSTESTMWKGADFFLDRIFVCGV